MARPRYRELTATQKRVLEAIRSFQERNGFAPTVRELCDILGLHSTSTVKAHLDTLERKGAIARIHGSPRTIRILREEVPA
jgi:repressor LexA